MHSTEYFFIFCANSVQNISYFLTYIKFQKTDQKSYNQHEKTNKIFLSNFVDLKILSVWIFFLRFWEIQV